MNKYTLCFLLITIPLILADGDCRAFIQGLQNHRNDASPPYSFYFQSSGIRGILDLGNKTKCELNANMRFYIIHSVESPMGVATAGFRARESGVCLPDYCDKQMLKSDTALLRQLGQVNGWPVGGNIAFHDPNETPPRGLLFYTLINAFYLLVGLCIASTVVQCITRFVEKRKSQDPLAPVKKDYSVWVFKSFDVVGNLKSLYATAEENGQSDHLATFGFLRLIAIIWVIAFHAMCRNLEMYKSAAPTTHPQTDRVMWIGDIAPGYFFFMGGFLAVYTIASKASRDTGSGLIGYLSDIMHRFFKVYPGACVAILFYWIVMPGLINGNLWPRYIGAIQVCEERWRDKFTLWDNWSRQPFDHCASWTWYIDVDFQVYPLIAFLAYVFIQHRYMKYIVYLAIFYLIHWSTQVGFEKIREAERTGQNPKELWYLCTYARIYEILIGAFFGFQYYEYAKLKLKSNLVYLWERYADFRYLTIAIGAYISYYTIFTEAPETLRWSFNEWEYIKRFYLGIGAALFFIPLANDSLSILKAIMNLRIFQILGKLCFGAFLLHWPLQLAVNFTVETIPERYDHFVLMDKIKWNVIHSFAAAFVYYLVLEKPLLNIEAHFTKRQRNPAAAVDNTENVPKSAGYKVLSELPDNDMSTVGQSFRQNSIMDASIIEDNLNQSRRIESSPLSPTQSMQGYYYIKNSARDIQQVGQTMSEIGDVEMGKYAQSEEKELNKSRNITINNSPTSERA